MDAVVRVPRRTCSGIMEGGRGLASLIRELQGEIKKLESENRVLRGQLSTGSESPGPAEEENSTSTHLRRNVSAPALEGQYKENIIMTVRRYSISSNTITVPRRSSAVNSDSSGGSSAFNGPAREESSSARDRPASRRSLQQCVNQSRAKVKTVTFLLPVEDIYTNRPVLANDMPDRRSRDLNAIAESDS